MKTHDAVSRMRRGIAFLTVPLVLAGALTVTLSPAAVAAAYGHNNSTALTLQVPSGSNYGNSVTVGALLTDSKGKPLAGETVSLAVGTSYFTHARTGFDGKASLTIPGTVLTAPGSYLLHASFTGNFSLGQSSASATLTVVAPAPTSGSLSPGSPPVKRTTTTASATVATSLTVETPTGSVIGKDVAITAVLHYKTGQGLPDERVSLSLDGTEVRSDKTDAQGSVTLIVPGKTLAEARAYAVLVAFNGSHGFAPSTAKATLTVLAAAIQIQTVPALPNMRFTLGNEVAMTGPDGVAALPVPKSGTYQLAADLNPDTSPTATIKASFVRWLDNVYTADRTIDVSGPATYVIGLRIAYRATVQYVDLEGNPIDPTLIDQAQFSTGTGADDVVLNSQTGANDVWWTAASTIHVSTMLIPSQVTYRVLSVKIHGAEVVNRGQQAWAPTQSGVWTVELLLYGMTVQARDAVFGTPVSGKLTLTYPDGVSVEQHLASDGRVTFSNLPRGQYKLSLSPAAFSPPTPVALSRAQDATLRVITYMDVILTLGALILVIVVLAVIGRWSLIRTRLRRSRRETREPASS